MTIDYLSALSGSFFARVCAPVAIADRCPGPGQAWPAADNDSLQSLPYPPRTARAPGCHYDRRPADSIKGFYTVERFGRDHGPDRARVCLAWLSSTPDGEVVFGPHLHSDAPTYRNSSCYYTPCCRLWIWARRGPAARGAHTPPRVPRPRRAPPTAATFAPAASPVPTVTIPSDRGRAAPLGTPLLRLTPPPGDTSTALIKLDALGDGAELQFADPVARYSHADWERKQQAGPTCHAACVT